MNSMRLFMIRHGLKIDIDKKAEWINKRFPTVKILKAFNSPKQFGLDEESVKIQMEYLIKIIKDIPVNYFYSSEQYGKYVAEYLNIQNVVVDENRTKIPVSAKLIRNDIEKYKNFLDLDVLKDFIGD